MNSYAIRHNDFWRYDIAGGVWEDLSALTGTSAVQGRHYFGQACDAEGNFYILGGYLTPSNDSPPSFILSDFWKFDAAAVKWVRVPDEISSGTGIVPRIPYAMVHYPATNQLLVFGGADGFDLSNETEALDLTGAVSALPTATPMPTATPQRHFVPLVPRSTPVAK